MLIAGDDEDAKRIVGDVLADFGWPDPLHLGGIEGARELEAICIAWVKIGGARGAWDHGFSCWSARQSTSQRGLRDLDRNRAID